MATRPIEGSVSAFPATPPMPAVARILARFEREQLAGFIAVALDLIDTLDGDDELEANGDELDGSLGEDDFSPQNAPMHLGGPGCPVSDPDMAVDDHACDEPEQDRECEQMAQDVPTVPCFAIEPDDDGKRAFVGYWNPGSFVGGREPTS